MNELQLGLVGAGAAIVIGVVVYNGLQGRRARRRLPRTMPDGPAEAVPFAPLDAHEEHPFIHPTTVPRREPASAPAAAYGPASAGAGSATAGVSGGAASAGASGAVPLSAQAGAAVGAATSRQADAPASRPAGSAKTSSGDPVAGGGALPLAGDLRREPTFGGVNDLIPPADLPAGAAAAEWAAGAEPPRDAGAPQSTSDAPTPPGGGASAVRGGAAAAGHVAVGTAPLDARVVSPQVGAVDGTPPAVADRGPGAAADAAMVGTGAAAGNAAAAPAPGAPADSTADAVDAGHAGTAAEADAVLPREEAPGREPVLSPVEPQPQSPATTVSNLPPVVVDRRIDCIIELEPGEVVSGERIIPLAIRFRRAGSKPVYVEGRDQDGHWGTLRPGNQYSKLRAAVQMANRAGSLNELEFSEFVGGVHRLADALDAAAEFPDMTEVVQMARELDGFAAQCDAQLSVNVLSDNAPWSGSYVQAVASQDGLLLSRDGTRFVKLDAQQNPVFTLTFEGTNFLRDDLTYKGGHMITLLLDVPVADEDILPWRLMCDYARSLAQRIGARVVDDSRRVLPDSSLQDIDERLMTLYARLETAGIPAGSPAARRLFSS